MLLLATFALLAWPALSLAYRTQAAIAKKLAELRAGRHTKKAE